MRAFLSNLADEYEAVLVDNKQLRERLVEQDGKLGEYRTIEQTLRDTLMTAEKVAQDARETARREGEVLVAEARQRVARVLAEGREQLNDLRREALAIHREKEAYLGRFRSFAEAQIQFVEQHRGDFRDLDGRLLDQFDLTATAAATSRPAAALAASDGAVGAAQRAADQERDQWREYHVAAEKEAARAAAPRADQPEAEHIAEVVKQAEAAQQPVAEPPHNPAPEESPHH
ncbi:MAG: DivIVA domain-containing protein [Candidatus Krumholzibacteriia bacterium]